MIDESKPDPDPDAEAPDDGMPLTNDELMLGDSMEAWSGSSSSPKLEVESEGSVPDGRVYGNMNPEDASSLPALSAPVPTTGGGRAMCGGSISWKDRNEPIPPPVEVMEAGNARLESSTVAARMVSVLCGWMESGAGSREPDALYDLGWRSL